MWLRLGGEVVWPPIDVDERKLGTSQVIPGLLAVPTDSGCPKNQGRTNGVGLALIFVGIVLLYIGRRAVLLRRPGDIRLRIEPVI